MPDLLEVHKTRMLAITARDPSISLPRAGRRVLLVILTTPIVLLSCSPEPQGPFTANAIQEYISLLSVDEEAREEDFVVGKVVVINVGDALSHHYRTAFTQDDDFAIRPGTISAVHDKLTPGLRAAEPGQVGTVALLKWRKNVLAKNIAGIEFVQAMCDVTIIDVKKRSIIGKGSFAGSKPQGRHRWGSSPENDIAEYINRLPRK